MCRCYFAGMSALIECVDHLLKAVDMLEERDSFDDVD